MSGVTAHFSSPWDPAAFSIQNQGTTFFVLPKFSGNYLYQNESSRIKLRIESSRTLISITMTFATIEYHDVGEVDQPTAIELTAYLDSTVTPAVGSATARGGSRRVIRIPRVRYRSIQVASPSTLWR